MTVRSRLIIPLLTLCSLLCAAAPAARAAIAVTPARTVRQAAPLERLNGFFWVENQGDEAADVSVEPEDWSRSGEGARQAAAWLTIKPQRLTLKPRERAKVKYTVRVPKDATGELRAQVFFTKTTQQGGMNLRGRLGVAFYVAIEGTTRLELTLLGMGAAYTAGTPGVSQPDRLDVTLSLRNSGNTHVVPQARVLVIDAQNQVVAEAAMPQAGGMAPGRQNTYHAIAQGVYLKPGRYTLRAVMEGGDDLDQPFTVESQRALLVAEDAQVSLLPLDAPADAVAAPATPSPAEAAPTTPAPAAAPTDKPPVLTPVDPTAAQPPTGAAAP